MGRVFRVIFHINHHPQISAVRMVIESCFLSILLTTIVLVGVIMKR